MRAGRHAEGENTCSSYDQSAETGEPPRRTSITTARSVPEFKRVSGTWSLPDKPYTVHARLGCRALQIDGRRTNLAGDWSVTQRQGQLWQPGAGDVRAARSCLIQRQPNLHVRGDLGSRYVSDRGWRADLDADEQGLLSQYELPDPDAEVGHCVHRIYASVTSDTSSS